MGRKSTNSGANDEYYTPKYGVEPILKYCEPFKTIWCPCDKEWSNFVILLRERGHTVIHTHIDEGQDFLTYEPDFHFDAIVTNPPFSIKHDIIAKCQSYGKPYCLLLPATLFFSKSSIRAFNKDLQLLIIDGRISYDGKQPNFNSWYMGGNNFFEEDINFHYFEKSCCLMYKEENN